MARSCPAEFRRNVVDLVDGGRRAAGFDGQLGVSGGRRDGFGGAGSARRRDRRPALPVRERVQQPRLPYRGRLSGPPGGGVRPRSGQAGRLGCLRGRAHVVCL